MNRKTAARAALLALLAMLGRGERGGAQNLEHQVVASQFGEFQVPSVGNGYAFPASACQVTGGGKNFDAFAPGVPIKIVDVQPSQTEVVVPVAVFIHSCVVSLPAAYMHSSFYLTSGTGGLQEAIANGGLHGGANTIVLDAEWYALIAPRSAATVIGSVAGQAALGLVDVTTAPYTSYSWNGSQYVAVTPAGGGGGVTPATAYAPAYYSAGGVTVAGPAPFTGLGYYSTSAPPAAATQSQVQALAGAGQANGVASLDFSGHVPAAQVPATVPSLTATTPQLFSSGLTMPQVNNVFYADGFSPLLFGGIGQAPVPWVSGADSPACQEVSYSGSTYLATSRANTGETTPGTDNTTWYPMPGPDSPTMTECAFYWALAAGTSRTSPVVLKFGGSGTYNGTYGINGPLVMPPTGAQVEMIGESRGDNGAPAQIFAQAAMNTMLSKPSLTVNVSTPYNLHLANLAFNGNNLANHAFDFDGAKVGLIEHVNIKGMVGTDWWLRLGDGTAGALGYNYQWVVNDVQLESAGTSLASWASITATASGGAPTFTLAGGGSYNYATPVVHVSGTGASGAASQPCTTMGTVTPVMSGTGPYTIASLTATGFAGCGGNIYVLAPDQPAAQYGFFLDYITDSSFTDLIDDGVGTAAGILANHSGNSFLHAHPYDVPVGIISNNQNLFVNTELDSTYLYGAEPNAKDSWANTNLIYNGAFPASKGFYLGTQATFNSMGSTCAGVVQPGYALVTTAAGDIAHGTGTAYPPGFRVQGQQCDDLSLVNALPALNATSLGSGTTAVTQATGDNTTRLATDAFVLANGSSASASGYYAGTATGAVNALAVTLPAGSGSPTLAGLTGLAVTFFPNLANTVAAPTLNVNGLGAVTVSKGLGMGLAAGDLSAAYPALVVYNGSGFLLLNPQVALYQTAGGNLTMTGALITGSVVQSGGGYQANSKTTALVYQGGQDTGYGGNVGSATLRGGNNSSTGGAGNTVVAAGANTSTGLQGFATVMQSFTTAAALANPFEVVSMAAADQVQAAPAGSPGSVGVAQTVGGAGAQLFVAHSGKSTVRFDGTPVVGDVVCAPPAGGSPGLAHSNGAVACANGQRLGVVTGQVSGTGSGATATVLLVGD